MVLSYDSFRTRSKDGRKAYQANGNLAAFASVFGTPEQPIENADDTALFQVINQLNPVVIVDESHHDTSTLSREMLTNFNPAFILDLTATPREQSNVISYVDALALKSENMVKLPVIAYNRTSQTEVITDAIDLRQSLESAAVKREAEGGGYIRPIVLFQAQPKTGEDVTSFERLREKLVAAGIPAEQIAIKTCVMMIKGFTREIIVKNLVKSLSLQLVSQNLSRQTNRTETPIRNLIRAVQTSQVREHIAIKSHVVSHNRPITNESHHLVCNV